MRIVRCALIVVIACTACSGCASAMCLRDGVKSPPYLGTQLDAVVVAYCISVNLGLWPESHDIPAGYPSFVYGCLALADLPLSMVVDTVVLPFTLTNMLNQPPPEEPLPDWPAPESFVPNDDCYSSGDLSD
jgi:uncharacterized protein YceK